MSIDTLFQIDQKQAKIDEYVANLKKNPKQVGEYKKLVLNAGLDHQEAATMLADIPHMKEKGFLIDDIPITWKEHRENTPEGHLPIKLSTYKQLSGDDLSIANSVKLCFYDDVGGHSAKVNHYSANNGLDVSCGYNNKPYGSRITQIDSNNPEDVKKFKEAEKNYTHAMEQWQFRKKDIMEGRGTTYKEWNPLPQATIDTYEKAVEVKSRQEYKAWQSAQQKERVRSYTGNQITAMRDK